MFDPDHIGGGGGGDPWDRHPLVLAVRAEVDRQNRLVVEMHRHLRVYRILTITNIVLFGSFAIVQIAAAVLL